MLAERREVPPEPFGEMFVARLVAGLPGPSWIRELVRGKNPGGAEPAPEPKLERGPGDVRVRGELLEPEPPPRGEALGAGLLCGAARGLLGAGLDDRDLTLGARVAGAGKDDPELFSIRDLPELLAGREMPEPPLEGEFAEGSREELRPIGSLPRLTRELDSAGEPVERDAAVERVSRPPNRLQPSFPPLELELDGRTEELLDVPLAPLVSVPALVPSRRLWLNKPRSLLPRTEDPAVDSVAADSVALETAPGEPSLPLGMELPPAEPRAALCPRTLPASPPLSPGPPRTTDRPAPSPAEVPPATVPLRTDPVSRRCEDSLNALTDCATCCC